MPKHIILSRKGFDSSKQGGRYPSPIIGKDLLSFPIPNGNIPYSKLKYGNKTYSSILSDLTEGKFTEKTCHLDPDIKRDALKPRPATWKPLFGPGKPQYKHLMERGVGPGDLMLFYGWFYHTKMINGKLSYSDEPDFPSGMHVIWGFMEIGEILSAEDVYKKYSWARYHPHVFESDRTNEHLFIARKAGAFPFSKNLILTKRFKTRSKWHMPFLKDIEMSCNPNRQKRWNEKEGYFQTVGRGQEFVLKADLQVMKWVNTIIN